MADFEKTKKAIGVEKIDEQARASMFKKFQEAGGKIVEDKSDKDKEKQNKKSSSSKSQIKSSGSGKTSVGTGNTKFFNRGTGEEYDLDDSEEGSKTSIAPVLDEDTGSFINRMFIRFKCWANNVTSFTSTDLLPQFLSELNLEGKAAMMELKMTGNDLLANPSHSPGVVKALDKINPIYVELLGRGMRLFDPGEMADIFEDYNVNPTFPVSLPRISKPLYSVFTRLYYMYPHQATYRKAIIAGYDALQRLEKKPPLIYASKKKKAVSEVAVLFDKIFEKLYLAVIRNENKNIPMISLYMESLLGITEDEKPGKRKIGENLPPNAGGEEAKEETDESKEEIKEEAPKVENKELNYGYKLMSSLSMEALKKKYDPKNEYAEFSELDKAFIAFMCFKEFDYEYSFVLTTKKINIKQPSSSANKVDNKAKLLGIYEMTRPCHEQFKIYFEVIKEFNKHKANPGANYIEASKKNTQLDQKRSQQSRNLRGAIKEYMEKTSDMLEELIDDMKGAREIVGNMEEVVLYDSVESKKRLFKKPVKQYIMEAYCFSTALASRLSDVEDGGDLFGSVLELNQEQIKSFSDKEIDLSITEVMDTGRMAAVESDPKIISSNESADL